MVWDFPVWICLGDTFEMPSHFTYNLFRHSIHVIHVLLLVSLQCPESMRHSVSRNKDDYEDYDTSRDTPTEKTLVKLHKRVIEKSQAHKRTHAQWNMLMERAFELEDIEANEGNRDRTFKHSFTPTNRGLLSTIYTPQAGIVLIC